MSLVKKNKRFRRVRTPTIIQMEAVECGVASLAIVLGYHKKYLPLEILRVDCGVSRDGSNLLNLLKAAEKYGLKAQGYKRDAEELFEVSLPAILFWEFRHFLVLEGFGKKCVYLNDPATGPKEIPYEEFERSYSGVVLTFEKGESFQESGEKPTSLAKQLYDRLKTIPHLLGFTLTTGLCLLLPGFALPAFLMIFIDTFFAKSLLPWGMKFLGAVLLAAIFAGSLTWMRLYYVNRLNGKLSIQFSSKFLWHLLQLPMEFYAQRYPGEIAYRIGLNDSVINSLTGSLLFSAIDLLLVIFYGVVMFFYDWSIALIGVFMGAVSLITMLLIYRARSNAYACLQQDMAKSVGESIGGLHNIESIKAKGQEAVFFSKWAGYITRRFNAYQFIGKKDAILVSAPVFFQMLASALLLGVGSYRILEGSLTVGMLMALQILMTNFLQPVNRFVALGQTIQNVKIQLDRLNDVLKNPTDPIYGKKEAREIDKKKLEGHVEFRDVTFGYALLSPPLIEKLSFTIEPGKRIAFVGPTGSGKSTVAKLASGLFRPWSGQILYDGIPLEEIPREVLCNSVATVDQEIFLFAGTIRENITLWNHKVPEEILIAAGRHAEIHEEIIERSGGYDAPLIEGGRNLSGGQRQRLEIARALLYNPSLLILDEATSALDSHSEKKISDHVKQRGCSALMIAQRLSTIQDCDEIIVLDQGKVAQRGTHNELKAIPGIYQELISASSFDE